MGITGLLPLLKSIQRKRHIREWSGKTVGIDAYGWLHKGIISCAIDLALEKQTTKYVDYVMNRVRMLRHFGVTPYLVFDGDYLPSKARTEAERGRKRAQSKAAGLELLKLGRINEAHLQLQKSIDVTPTMARHIIDACAAIDVKCLVAPYEADSQLYYLEKLGIIHAVVSEDSDLLVFGVRSLITKLDPFGECIEVNRELFTACKDVSLVGWTQTDFRHMCILSGCDYLDNIPSLGLKTAHRLIRVYKNVEKALKAVQLEGKMTIPQGYGEAFKRADLTFQYQRVFCPILEQMVMANEPGPDVIIDDEILVYIGPEVEVQIARQIARGDLDPITKMPIEVAKSNSKANPFSPVLALSSQYRAQNPNNNKTITSFFKPKSEPKGVKVLAPLQLRNSNEIRTLNPILAPIRTISSSMKRPLPTVPTPENKKPRIVPPHGNTYTDSKTATSSERSAFFLAQSKRPIGTHRSRTPIHEDGTENSPPKSTKADLAHAHCITPVRSCSQNRMVQLSPKPSAGSVRRVSQGWRQLYGFSESTQKDKLSTIIHSQRRGSERPTYVAKQITSLQHMGAKTLGNRCWTKKLAVPLDRSMQPTVVECKGEIRPEPIGVNSSITSSSTHQGKCELNGAFGIFDRFTFDKRELS